MYHLMYSQFDKILSKQQRSVSKCYTTQHHLNFNKANMKQYGGIRAALSVDLCIKCYTIYASYIDHKHACI